CAKLGVTPSDFDLW
nr:immunoglobulin heavy chain junction region [Macaca mulatta]MOX03898.1 immunoglobulin heavy chain junction region [Macaca mulatta]MOX05880.1 immunoglobulin heavy chain junction region [Macaca mulatta]MOX06899.1 immunoglobulin heavy chain junction region [Macaca mulatta]